MGLKEIGCEAVDWIELAQSRGHCLAILNTMPDLRVPLTDLLSAFHERLCSMESVTINI